MSNRVVTATEFKAKCLALLDEVNETGETLTVTKRGKAVATIQGASARPFQSLKGVLVGKVKIVGDLEDYSVTNDWNCTKDSLDDSQ
ncbi:type II toxin-antitoxin system Phd/YefM family antitoxin [Bryobacter aggregatus]|uniref:type II toxin-antitoxin system Phd/YefM family antitoxin n=1 Tax=Bryobacter aggregatus TaxID=360054 RepID=UPI0004E207AA|nr:type II toxin-antitoxin system Phd/YefM family antitoxin [Bryobacter aggregatus]